MYRKKKTVIKKQASKKKVQTVRKARLVKPVRNQDRPVEVIFQCFGGGRLSKSKELVKDFNRFLKEEGLENLFRARSMGLPKKGSQTGADLLVSSVFERRDRELLRNTVKLPENTRPIYLVSNDFRAFIFPEERRKLFQQIVNRSKKMFNLET